MLTVYETPAHIINFVGDTITDKETGKEQSLERRQKQILHCLISRKNVILERGEIIDTVYGIDAAINNEQIDKQIHMIRRLLGSEGNLYIRSKRGMGYYWYEPIEKGKKYKPFDGLKNCFTYFPNAKHADIYIQMGRKLFSDKDAADYFHTLVEKGVKFRIVINTPEAVSVSYNDECFDHIDSWDRFSSNILFKDAVSVRVSDKTFHERLFLVYEDGKRCGAADIRNYHYSVKLPDVQTQLITSEQKKKYDFYASEFENIWEMATPLGDYRKIYRAGKESFDRRMLIAYEKKEAGDTRTFINILKNLSDEGFDLASNRLAVCYAKGEHTHTDHEKAVALFEKAAEAGNRDAIFNLGVYYWFGFAGLPQDLSRAAGFFRKLSDLEQPDGDACFYLYLAYRDGRGVKPDPDMADWYRRMAEELGVTSQNTRGLGVADDE